MDLATDRIVQSPRIADRRRAVRAERRRRKRRIALGLVLAGALTYGGWELSRSLLFGLSEVSVVGTTQVAQSDILEASGLRLGQSALGIDLEAVEARIRALPSVRDVTVERDGTLAIKISVTERVPAVEIRVGGEKRYLDQDGRSITGMAPQGRIPAIVLDRGSGTLLPRGTVATVLSLWTRMPAAMQRRVDWFAVPASGAITFRMGAAQVLFGGLDRMEEKIDALTMIRARARRERGKLVKVDLRAPGRPSAVIV